MRGEYLASPAVELLIGARRSLAPGGAVARLGSVAALVFLAACAGVAPAGTAPTSSGIGFSAVPVPATSPLTPIPRASSAPTRPPSPPAAPTASTSKSPVPARRTTCPRNPLRGVYHPDRLIVLGTCRWFRGTVTSLRDEEDGDVHVDVSPSPGFGRFLDADNRRYQHGSLVTEIMPGQTLPVPAVGERVAVFGTWVFDSNHGWNEIHPIWAIRYLDSGLLVRRLPPKMPRYEPGEGGGSGSGGGGGTAGGGSCDPSYPTVCIPPPPPDLDCADVPYQDFEVLPPDPHGFDGDGDGIGCES